MTRQETTERSRQRMAVAATLVPEYEREIAEGQVLRAQRIAESKQNGLGPRPKLGTTAAVRVAERNGDKGMASLLITCRRAAREHPDLYQRVLNGELAHTELRRLMGLVTEKESRKGLGQVGPGLVTLATEMKASASKSTPGTAANKLRHVELAIELLEQARTELQFRARKAEVTRPLNINSINRRNN